MSFSSADCARARRDFPALARDFDGQPLAFLDSPGGTQVPQPVIDAIAHGYRTCNVNVGGAFATSEEVAAAVTAARAAAADLLGASSPDTISFGANMTTLNFALAHALGRRLQPGDEIIVTALDHEANRGPWLTLAERGAVIREVPLQADGTLNPEDFARRLNARTRIVALGLASNALGTVPDVRAVRALCRGTGAVLVCDAVHYAAHFPVDVAALDCDFLLCSAYKFYGPHVGLLYSRPGLLDALDTDCLRTQKQTAPYRIETGTLNHPAVMGVTAAVDYLARFGTGDSRRTRLQDAMQAIGAYEHALAARYARAVASLRGVRRWGPELAVSPRAPTVSITLAGHRPESVARTLAAAGIQVWHGHFYALRVLESLDLVAAGGLLRTGFALYNTDEEVDRLVASLARLCAA
ncbi:MAG: cysteine desulfurase-like protein [Gammaproteobacteria bacterium]